MTPDASGLSHEAARQQALLAAVLRRADAADLQPWLQPTGLPADRGLRAYRDNLAGSAERALAVAYPTVAHLVSPSSFTALARAYLQAEPPTRGDLAWCGETLPAFMAASASLADAPYLADVARLDWTVHRAGFAADGPGSAAELSSQLARLGDTDPDRLRLRFTPGAALVVSPHPIVSIWSAHQGLSPEGAMPDADAPDRFAAVRAAFAQGRADTAWVWRVGWRPQVQAVAPADAAFNAALLAGTCLGPALTAMAAHPDFAFEPWLIQAVQGGWLAALDVIPGR